MGKVHDLPSGTVTFLFSDIEGSTQLVRELGGGYSEVLAERHETHEASLALACCLKEREEIRLLRNVERRSSATSLGYFLGAFKHKRPANQVFLRKGNLLGESVLVRSLVR